MKVFSVVGRRQLASQFETWTPEMPLFRPIDLESSTSPAQIGGLTVEIGSTLPDITPVERIGSQIDGGRALLGPKGLITAEYRHSEVILSMFDDQQIMPLGGSCAEHAAELHYVPTQ
jgi:hypothetical protein